MPRLKEGQISSYVKNGRTYYRMSKGIEPDPKRPGCYKEKFWALGSAFKDAVLKKSAIEEVWDHPGEYMWNPEVRYAILAGVLPRHWTPEMIERVEYFYKQNLAFRQAIRTVALKKRADADRLLDMASRHDDGGGDEPQAVKPTGGTPESKSTLFAALDAYCQFVRTRPGSHRDKSRAVEAVEAFKHYEADQRAMLALDAAAAKQYLADPKASRDWHRDVPMPEVNYSYLERVTNYLKSRPLSRIFSIVIEGGKEKRKRLPIAPGTVKTLLSHWRRFFDWIDRHCGEDTFGRWELPRKHERLWEVDLTQIMNKAERDAASRGPDQILPSEIKALIDAARTTEHRLWCLFALFTAQGQTEMSCTRREEIDLDAGVVTHSRNKTGVLGTYWLPPEVVTLLKKKFEAAPAEPNALAFTTRDGQPLVTEKSDAVRQMYDDLRARVADKAAKDGSVKPIRPSITFYSLRRYYGDFQNRNGVNLETALSQTFKTVGGKHYSGFRDHEKQKANAVKLYNELKLAGVFDFAMTDKQRPVPTALE